MTRNDFKFWCPVEIEKAIDPTTGDEIMRLGGIASTSDKDSDGEFLDPKGFDIQPLIEKGMVNWHHQVKGIPAAIIGEPTKAEIRKEGLYIETDLYPSSPMAHQVWDLAQTLEKDSKTRRLGYSIEGKVLTRKSNDKKSSDYNVITKAIITGVAVTHQPKNPKTFANIIKGETNDLEEEEELDEKGLDTETGKAVVKESVDRKVKSQTFSKAEVMEKLFNKIPGIKLSRAEDLYIMLTKIANMAKRERVNDDDIKKAYEALGLNVEDNIQKGEESGKEEEEEDSSIKKAEKEEAEKKEEAEEKVEDEEEEKEEVKKGGVNRFDRIEKAIATSHIQTKNYIKATAVMLKDASQKLDRAAEREIELHDIIKAQNDTISEMSQKIEEFGSSSPAPKAVRHAAPVERTFSKGEDNEFEARGEAKKSNQVSMSNQKGVVANILDTATFSKGYDNEFSKACMHFEVSGNLPQSIISRIKNEMGIEIVK